MTVNLVALRQELDTDPLGIGYAGMSDVEAADSLNSTPRPVDRQELTGGMLAASVVPSEWAALTAAQKDAVRLYVSAGPMPLTDTLKSVLGALFPDPSQTRDNLIALIKRIGSRADELGLGRVTSSDVANARRL